MKKNELNYYKNIKQLKKKFIDIKKMGYVKAINNNSSGIGLTLEKLLGKSVDNFPLPDYNGIELKTKLAYSKNPITLFRLTPYGNDFFEINRLVNTYGYYTNSSSTYKYFNGSVNASKKTKIGSYYHMLNVNNKDKKIELFTYNKYGILIDNNTFWNFEDIENALYRKINILAYFVTYGSLKDNQRYYKYYKMNIYKLKSFYFFIRAIKKGQVSISFSVDIYKSGTKCGLSHNHGVCFKIYENDLTNIFYKIK